MYQYSMEVSEYYSSKDHFAVEELFNFNGEEANNIGEDNTAFEGINGNSSNSSIVATDASSGNSISTYGHHFPTDYCEPVEEVAELEWLSNFMEDCFSNKDSHHHHHHNNYSSSSCQSQDSSQFSSSSNGVTAKARSKRSRANPASWATRIPVLPTQEDVPESVQTMIATCQDGSGRRCLHCGSDRTPQWRMGPMGPKTLCNACGVRYKSGRLVPEYRPAASPSFVVSEHSNSHRKVVELRRQKEAQKQQKQHQNMLFWS